MKECEKKLSLGHGVVQIIVGALMGIGIWALIVGFISLAMGGQGVQIAAPTLIQRTGDLLHAYWLSLGVTALYGAISSALNLLLWANPRSTLSLVAQSLLHGVLQLLITFAMAYVLAWLPVKLGAIITFVVIFLLIYAAIWLGFFFSSRAQARKANAQLQKVKQEMGKQR